MYVYFREHSERNNSVLHLGIFDLDTRDFKQALALTARSFRFFFLRF